MLGVGFAVSVGLLGRSPWEGRCLYRELQGAKEGSLLEDFEQGSARTDLSMGTS